MTVLKKHNIVEKSEKGKKDVFMRNQNKLYAKVYFNYLLYFKYFYTNDNNVLHSFFNQRKYGNCNHVHLQI